MREFPDARAAELASRQWNVLSTAELLACGLTYNAIAARVRKGWLHPKHHGVYAVGTPHLTREGRFLAAVKACGPNAVMSHFSAAVLYELVRFEDRWPEVTVPGRGAREHEGINMHRTVTLEPHDVRRRFGIPVTSPARTLIDLAASEPHDLVRRAVRQAQSHRLVRLQELVAPGRAGAKTLAQIVSTGPAPTRSELEDIVLDLILEAGCAHPEVNQPLVLEGRTVYPDFRWPGRRLIVEADGRAFHDHKLAREDDAERQALLEAHGERVLRVTWRQAVTQPGRTMARLQEAYGSTSPRRIA